MDGYQPVSTTDNEGDATEEGGDAGGGEVYVHYGGGEEVHISQKGKMKGHAAQGGSAAGGGEKDFKKELLTAVEEGNEHRLRSALRHLSKKAINETFPSLRCTALHHAAKKNFPNLVTALLEAGADPNIQDLSWKRYYPLHHAAINGYAEVIKALLQRDADPNAMEGEFGSTALHLLTNNWRTNEDSYKTCLDALLICTKTNVDMLNRERWSPLFLAASRDWEYMVNELIYKGANIKATWANRTIEDVIRMKFPDLLKSIKRSSIKEPRRNLSEELYNALMCHDIELFRKTLEDIRENKPQSIKPMMEKDHGGYTMLQYTCEKGMTDFVEELLKCGADPLQVNYIDKNPILYAARNGYYKILKLLLLKTIKDDLGLDYKNCTQIMRDALKQTDSRGETALHKVVKREYEIKEEGVDYFKCLELLLLLDKKWLLNKLSCIKKQSLDSDAQGKCGNMETLVDLDAQDKFGYTALHHAVLNNDQIFVRLLLCKGANFRIENKFGTTALISMQPSLLEAELNNWIKSKEDILHNDFKIIFDYSLLVPDKSQKQEINFLKFLSDSHKHQHLLQHPLINTFLFLKWQRIKKYYSLNVLVYTVFLTLLTAYILLFHGTLTPSTNTDTSGHNATANKGISDPIKENMALKISLKVLISIFILFLVVREVLQFCVSWKLYIIRLKNWLEISIILLTCTVLFIPMEAAPQQSVCAWLVLFSWIGFMLLLGRHPYLSIYITMFTTVSYNFFKFIVPFSFMVVAFSISFYLVFQVQEDFTTYFSSLLKTLTMAAGEIGYTDLPLNAFPGSSHLLYVAFMFFIVLVLMNLLNGLAVSDIQKIQQEAKIISYCRRVEVMFSIESVLTHKIIPRLLRSCEGGEERDVSSTASVEPCNPIKQLLNHLGNSTLVFNSCLSTTPPTNSVFPNRDKNTCYACRCQCFHLDEVQIEAAKDVVMGKKQEDKYQQNSPIC